jgi:hypothetical protein
MDVRGSPMPVDHASAAFKRRLWLVPLFSCLMNVSGSPMLGGHASAANDE